MISAMLQYIQRSPDCFHAVEELRQRLLREGYTELRPGRWQLTAGGKYFTTKNGSSLMAFRLPQEAPAGFLLTASHSDSPLLPSAGSCGADGGVYPPVRRALWRHDQ